MTQRPVIAVRKLSTQVRLSIEQNLSNRFFFISLLFSRLFNVEIFLDIF